MAMWCLKKVKADTPTRGLLRALGPDYTYVDRYFDMEWVIVASASRTDIEHPIPGVVVKPWQVKALPERRSDVVIVHVVHKQEKAAARVGVSSIDCALDILHSIDFPLAHARRVFLNRRGHENAAGHIRAHRANLFYVQMRDHSTAAACLGHTWDAVPYAPHDAYVHVSQLCETTFTCNAVGEVSVDVVDGAPQRGGTPPAATPEPQPCVPSPRLSFPVCAAPFVAQSARGGPTAAAVAEAPGAVVAPGAGPLTAHLVAGAMPPMGMGFLYPQGAYLVRVQSQQLVAMWGAPECGHVVGGVPPAGAAATGGAEDDEDDSPPQLLAPDSDSESDFNFDDLTLDVLADRDSHTSDGVPTSDDDGTPGFTTERCNWTSFSSTLDFRPAATADGGCVTSF